MKQTIRAAKRLMQAPVARLRITPSVPPTTTTTPTTTTIQCPGDLYNYSQGTSPLKTGTLVMPLCFQCHAVKQNEMDGGFVSAAKSQVGEAQKWLTFQLWDSKTRSKHAVLLRRGCKKESAEEGVLSACDVSCPFPRVVV